MAPTGPKTGASPCPLREEYHTHTYRCLHALGDVSDYVAAARACGLRTLGFSDHTPLPDGRWPSIRMDLAELPEYLAAIDEVRATSADIALLKGMECDLDDVYFGFYDGELLGRRRLDYLVGAVHFFPVGRHWRSIHNGLMSPAELKAYAAHLVAHMSPELFAFVAHPDAFGCSYPVWDAHAEACSREILEAARDRDLPLEINTYGLRKPAVYTSQGARPMYPLVDFWELAAEYDVPVVVNSDAHAPQDLCGRIEDGLTLVKRFGLRLADMRERLGPARG